jgi:hypothetical protein
MGFNGRVLFAVLLVETTRASRLQACSVSFSSLQPPRRIPDPLPCPARSRSVTALARQLARTRSVDRINLRFAATSEERLAAS